MNTNIINHEAIGIDLGTRNIVASVYDETGTPRCIPIDGENLTLAVMYANPGLDEMIIGKSAFNMRALEPDRVIEYAKRDVGTDMAYFTDGETQITPCYVQAQQLKYIREQVAEYFGDKNAGRKAVITVPASADEPFRQSVMTSAKIAGIEVIEIINEPTAAAIDNGFQNNKGDRMLAVLDFGGGTFDISVGVMSAGSLTILASHGDKNLGGRDVNDLLVNEVLQRFKIEHGLSISKASHPHDFYEIEDEVERQKIMLSSKSKARIVCRIDGHTVDFSISRDDLERLATPIIDRISNIVAEALKESDVAIEDIDNVLFVGGSTRLKCFRNWAKSTFGADKLFDSKVSPDLTVSQGAAIRAIKLASESGDNVVSKELHAIPLPELNHQDVTANSLGVAAIKNGETESICAVILPKNSQIPAKQSKIFGSCSEDQTHFKVHVLQGEDNAPSSDCLIVGETMMILPPRSPLSDSLEVTMGYDRNGMVTVTVHDQISNRREDITVDFSKPSTGE